MKMTTSDERHEVAERLRKRECGWRKIGTHVSVRPDMPATQFEEISGLMGFNGWILNADIFARLADLIDPTCRMTDSCWDDGERTWGCICSACGAHIRYGRARSLDYCPKCGARVTDGGEG